MREILFKAKSIQTGEWVEGYYFKMSETNYSFKDDHICESVSEHHYILQKGTTSWGLPTQAVQIEIVSETLCQFTGLCDKNGNKIWENDILRLDDGTVLKVSWHHFKASWVISKKGWLYNHFFGEAVEPEDIEAIGNIYDNPELLQEERK